MCVLYSKFYFQKFTNIEIFQIFKKNKRVLLFLIEEKMIVIDDDIAYQMEINDCFNKYIDYFTPELRDRTKFTLKTTRSRKF